MNQLSDLRLKPCDLNLKRLGLGRFPSGFYRRACSFRLFGLHSRLLLQLQGLRAQRLPCVGVTNGAARFALSSLIFPFLLGALSKVAPRAMRKRQPSPPSKTKQQWKTNDI